MKSSKQQVFAELMADRANRLCVDCSTPNPQWASVSHGSFLCIKCAGVHRSLGVHISFVRSITMDSWSPLQIEKMKAGGNARFLAYLQKQKFPKKLPHEQKYDSKACKNYREHILAVSRGESAKDLPFIGFKKKIDTNLGDFQVSGSGRNQRSGSARTGSPARPSGNGFSHSRPGGPAMIGFGSDGAVSSQRQDSTWSWDNISTALKSAATTVADTSKVAATIVAEKSRTAAKSAQSLTSESDMASTFGQQANAGWGALRSVMSGAAASARSMVTEEDPVQFYRRDDSVNATSNHASSTAGFASKSLSSDAYFNATNQHDSSRDADSSKSRSSAEASLDAFFSDSPRIDSSVDLVNNEDAEDDTVDGFSWGFGDPNAVNVSGRDSNKEQKSLSSERASSKTRAKLRASKSTSVKREKPSDGWGFGDDSDDHAAQASIKKVEKDTDNVDDTWDWD